MGVGDPNEKHVPSRERILRSAVELFAENGYGSTSVKAIAGHAGVSPGLIYTYFESKEDLLRAIFAEGMEDVRSSLQRPEASDPISALEGVIRESFRLVREHESLWRLIYSLRFQPGITRRLSLELAEWSRAIEGALQDVCEEVGVPDPEIEAKVLFALIDGANQHRALDPDDYPVDAVIASVMRRYERSRSG